MRRRIAWTLGKTPPPNRWGTSTITSAAHPLTRIISIRSWGPPLSRPRFGGHVHSFANETREARGAHSCHTVPRVRTWLCGTCTSDGRNQQSMMVTVTLSTCIPVTRGRPEPKKAPDNRYQRRKQPFRGRRRLRPISFQEPNREATIDTDSASKELDFSMRASLRPLAFSANS